MSNQVSIRVDSRVVYLLLALVAVLGIFGIGWWLGNQLGGEQQAQTTVPTGDQAGRISSGALTGGTQAEAAVQPTQMLAGRPPVSAEEVPIGEGESRLWLEDMDQTNWTYDFGAIPSDGPSEHDFVITNIGNAELVILEASASCGCTAAIVADPTVSPGESTTVRVKYDPRTNREFGKFVKKQVRISSNDPIVPLVEFAITADVAAQ